uniref:Metalloendopeptidase n=1 Tax=Heterorhabditis bacteriophora TaxID=37862 RepID=A0A1I7XBJ6_HETBA
MSLMVGECIVDVEGELVTTVRQQILTLSDQKDPPLPVDTRLCAENGIAALKDMKAEPKPIYKIREKSEINDNKPKRISICEKTIELPVPIDIQTRLLVKFVEVRTTTVQIISCIPLYEHVSRVHRLFGQYSSIHHERSPIERPTKTGWDKKERKTVNVNMPSLLLTTLAIALSLQEEQITLLDLIEPTANRRLFDTLSASVANEYEGRKISFDSSKVFNYDEAPVSIKKLNEKYSSYLYEGDMVIHPDRLERMVANTLRIEEEGSRQKRKAFVDSQYPSTIWTQGVPYSLHYSLSSKAKESIMRAIRFWNQETCIEFRPRTTEKQFVEFIGNDDGCWSTVGKDDALGKQVVSIGRGCEHVGFGVTSHELAHALGVFHEQSRYDRDYSVNLNKNVISPNLLFNFAKLNIYGLPYDVGSVMHYTPTEFSSYKSIPALTTVDPNLQQSMGQMEGPSFLDVLVLNQHYRCLARCPRHLTCLNGGYINSRNCNECKCPAGFGGSYCQTVSASFSKGCGGEITVQEAVRRYDITIKQIGARRNKQCVYHLRVCEISLYQNEGSYLFYRFCCQESTQRRIISKTNVVPFIIYSTNNSVTLTFEYTFVDVNARFDADTTQASERAYHILEQHEDATDGVFTSVSKPI